MHQLATAGSLLLPLPDRVAAVPCPACSAPPNVRCVSQITGYTVQAGHLHIHRQYAYTELAVSVNAAMRG